MSEVSLSPGFQSIREYYGKRDADHAYEREWGYVNPVATAYWRLRDELVLPAVVRRYDTVVDSVRVLEVGCGYGHELSKFALLGIPQDQLWGVDLMESRIARARYLYPGIHFSQANAASLPFEDGSFDVVYQCLTVSHGMSQELQQQMCAEMIRVTRSGGIILSWDLAPMRAQVLRSRTSSRIAGAELRAKLYLVKKLLQQRLLPGAEPASSIRSTYLNPIQPEDWAGLFPGCEVTVQRAGVDYEIWDAVWRRNPAAAERLWRSGTLSAHTFAVINKR